MALTAAGLNAAANALGTLATHLGLVNAGGTELSGGTYARVANTWTSASAGLIRPAADRVFNVPASTTVGGWRAYSASTAGTDYGGDDAMTDEVYAGAGTFTLLAASTAIDFD